MFFARFQLLTGELLELKVITNIIRTGESWINEQEDTGNATVCGTGNSLEEALQSAAKQARLATKKDFNFKIDEPIHWIGPFRLANKQDKGVVLTTPDECAKCDLNVYNNVEGHCYGCGWEPLTISEALLAGSKFIRRKKSE